ncbi:hypothetical protein [Nonomuraea sp. NPDC003709]|uniref:hypothetical protein n=1 Tax=Nonomuraea sp. NPDC003709 TaxID=3154450 RepID=UPI0033A5A952
MISDHAAHRRAPVAGLGRTRPTIAAVVVVLPVLAAALGGLFAREPAGSAPGPEKAI